MLRPALRNSFPLHSSQPLLYPQKPLGLLPLIPRLRRSLCRLEQSTRPRRPPQGGRRRSCSAAKRRSGQRQSHCCRRWRSSHGRRWRVLAGTPHTVAPARGAAECGARACRGGNRFCSEVHPQGGELGALQAAERQDRVQVRRRAAAMARSICLRTSEACRPKRSPQSGF